MKNKREFNPEDAKTTNKRMKYPVIETIELMPFLQKLFPEKSRTAVKSYLTHRQVYVNNQIITQFNYLLKPGFDVLISGSKIPTTTSFTGMSIVYEDEYIIVIDKNSGLLSIATSSEKEMTAYSQLRNYVKQLNENNKLFVLHRLDKETSGVMMFAKSAEIQEEMQRNWQRYVTKRTYIAVLEGCLREDEGTFTSFLTEDKMSHKVESHEQRSGREAISHFKVLKKNIKYSLVEFQLDTGRKNQIRVHAQSMGHPIIGDKKYGGKPSPIGRLGLHANILEFTHPVLKTTMLFKSPMPFKMNFK